MIWFGQSYLILLNLARFIAIWICPKWSWDQRRAYSSTLDSSPRWVENSKPYEYFSFDSRWFLVIFKWTNCPFIRRTDILLTNWNNIWISIYPYSRPIHTLQSFAQWKRLTITQSKVCTMAIISSWPKSSRSTTSFWSSFPKPFIWESLF